MRRRLGCAVVSLLSVTCIGSAVSQPLPTMNFMGKSICLSVFKPNVRGVDYSVVPDPTLRMDLTVGRGKSDAEYSIVFPGGSNIVVGEQPATDERCSGLPLNRFQWRADPDGQHADATFCITSATLREKILIRAKLEAKGYTRGELSYALLAVAACRMTRGPDQYTPDDTLSFGPEVIAEVP